jgi:pimeloyl-ACP methyl ester carboxylesterase
MGGAGVTSRLGPDGEEEEEEEEEEEQDMGGSQQQRATGQGTTNGSLGGATTAISIPGLNLEGLAVGRAEREELDCFCHLEGDTVLTYRVLRSSPRPRAHKHGSVLEDMADARLAAQALHLLSPQLSSGFMLLVLPDVTMTLDSLQTALGPLLDRYANGSVLLVGLPGCPHTIVPPRVKLSNEQNALYAAQLLAHVQERRLWDPLSAQCPFFMLGFGAGASVALKLATSYLPPDQKQYVESVVLVNPVAGVDVQLRRTVGDLTKVLKRATHGERMHLLTYLHFSDGFLHAEGGGEEEGGKVKGAALLKEFWDTRATLLDSSTTPLPGSRGEGTQLDRGLPKDAPLLRKLQGLLHNSDALPLLQDCEVPVVLVQSTGNRLFAPLSMEALAPLSSRRQKYGVTGGGFHLVDSPRRCLRSERPESREGGDESEPTNTKPVHVSWLKVRW